MTNSYKFYTILVATMQQALTRDIKVGLISDLHLQPNYDSNWGPYTDAEGDCIVDGGVLADTFAPMGRYGCDSPQVLIETMLDVFIQEHG